MKIFHKIHDKTHLKQKRLNMKVRAEVKLDTGLMTMFIYFPDDDIVLSWGIWPFFWYTVATGKTAKEVGKTFTIDVSDQISQLCQGIIMGSATAETDFVNRCTGELCVLFFKHSGEYTGVEEEQR